MNYLYALLFGCFLTSCSSVGMGAAGGSGGMSVGIGSGISF